MTTPPQDPPSPQDPPYPPYPQYPAGPQDPAGAPVPAPPPDPRRLRAGRVWAGIGIGIGANILGSVVSIALFNVTSSNPALSTIASGLSLLVFLAVIVVGIVLMVRGDRSLGLGLLIGGAGVPIVAAGVCVAIILAIGASGGFG